MKSVGTKCAKLYSLSARQMCLAQIKHLRTVTGSPIGECKKALVEWNNDIDKAKEWLREQGSAYADRRNERVTSQGQIVLKVGKFHKFILFIVQHHFNLDSLGNNAQTAYMIELNWETDFVAKTDLFKNGIKEYLRTLEQTKDFETDFESSKTDEAKQKFLSKKLTKSLDSDLKEMTAHEALTFMIAKTRENCNIGQVLKMNLEGNKMFGNYLHNSSEEHMGKLGSLVVLNSSKSTDISNIADAIAMHITAMKPEYLSKTCVPAGEKVNEKLILENQEFVSPDNTDGFTVKEYIKHKGKEMGASITIEKYVIFNCS